MLNFKCISMTFSKKLVNSFKGVIGTVYFIQKVSWIWILWRRQTHNWVFFRLLHYDRRIKWVIQGTCVGILVSEYSVTKQNIFPNSYEILWTYHDEIIWKYLPFTFAWLWYEKILSYFIALDWIALHSALYRTYQGCGWYSAEVGTVHLIRQSIKQSTARSIDQFDSQINQSLSSQSVNLV